MPKRDVVVVAASAGGVEALIDLVKGFPGDFPAAVCVVLHLPAGARSMLPDILSRAGPLPARHAIDGEPVEPGRIYVARPNQHLLIEEGCLRLDDAPRENRVRPAADPLFRSAARCYGQRVIGVVLSGSNGDGTLGLEAIKLRGGVAVVQDPAEAAFPSMPESALEHVPIDYVRRAAELPALLLQLADPKLTKGEADTIMSSEPSRTPDETNPDSETSSLPLTDEKHDGRASGLTCPDCHGSIWELVEGRVVSFECRVGHRYDPEAFLGAQSSRVEDALWTACNVLQERAATLRQFASRFDEGSRLETEYTRRAEDTDQQASIIRTVIRQLIRTETATEMEAP